MYVLKQLFLLCRMTNSVSTLTSIDIISLREVRCLFYGIGFGLKIHALQLQKVTVTLKTIYLLLTKLHLRVR